MGGARRGLASLISRGEEALKRGWFGVNALKRIATNEDPRAQLAKEKTYFKAHKAAQEKRRAVAAQVDAAAARYGPLLGWRAKMDSRTTSECRDAHGRNFRADRRPEIGWPGTTHPHCRCEVVAPYDNPKRRDIR